MRSIRTFATLLAFSLVALATLAPVASAGDDLPIRDTVCVTVRPGVIACGFAVVSFPSVGAGSGVATGIVSWKLTVYASGGSSSSPTVPGPAAALAAVGPSMTRDCATAVLTADGVTVASDTLCWDL